MMENQIFIGPKNKYFNLLLQHYQKILFFLLVTVLAVVQVGNKFVLKGAETYYHLAEHFTWQGLLNNPLLLINISQYLPEKFLFLIPSLLAILSLIIVLNLTKKTLSERFTFLLLLITILSPAFVWTFATLSSYSFFIFLTLLTLFLLSKAKLKYLATIPLLLAAMFDLISILLLTVILGILYFKHNKKYPYHITLAGTALLLAKYFLLDTPIIYDFLLPQQTLTDLITDFGGVSGISFFVIILAFIGFATTWKKKNFMNSYIFLPIVIIAFILNTQTIIYLNITLTFFATVGLIQLFDKRWNLITLKKFTLLLVILGILFSTLVFINRIPSYSPTEEALLTFQWVQENTPETAIFFSLPQESSSVKHFAQRNTIPANRQLHHQIIYSAYVSDLFPLLEQHNINHLYISPELRKILGEKHGLLFLLKNERFKLLFSHQQTEVWAFD